MDSSISTYGLALVFLTPALGGFIFGYDIGATSFVLKMLCDPEAADQDVWWSSIAVNNIEKGLFVSAISLGALIGSHVVLFYLAHSIGRRTEIRICAILYLTGTALNVISGTVLRNSSELVGFTCLIAGRLLFGTGVGFIMHGAPTYMAEMCPATIRGSVVTAKEAFIVIGIVVGYGSGDLLSSDPLAWSNLYGCTIIVTLPMLVMTTLIPRSVRWLLMNGFEEEARQSIQFVYRSNADEEFELLCEQILDKQRNFPKKQQKQKFSLFSKTNYTALTASIGLVMLQQFSGQPSIISYVTVLFSAAGLNGNSSVWTAMYMVLNASFTVLMVDRWGRKVLLKTGCVIMLGALLALSVSFWQYHPDNTDATSNFGASKGVILLAMFLYIGAFQLAFGPITWLIVSEVFPLENRGEATAFLVELNYCLNFLVQFLVPSIQDFIGWGPTFAVFACILAFAIHFVHKYVPETKGKTLEEIEQELQDKSSVLHNSESAHLLMTVSESMTDFGSLFLKQSPSMMLLTSEEEKTCEDYSPNFV